MRKVFRSITHHYFTTVLILLSMTILVAFKESKEILNLADLFKKGKLETMNRDITVNRESGRDFISLGTRTGEGAVWLSVKLFRNGRIKLVARGKDVLQGSFMGIYFHGKDTLNFDNVYLRPFNFRATDPVRKIHAIQYSSAPTFSWEYLRKEKNGIYEKGIEDAPKANDWVTLEIVIDNEVISAYVNDSKTPSLEVKKLNRNTTGKVGISGFNADFQSIEITYAD